MRKVRGSRQLRIGFVEMSLFWIGDSKLCRDCKACSIGKLYRVGVITVSTIRATGAQIMVIWLTAFPWESEKRTVIYILTYNSGRSSLLTAVASNRLDIISGRKKGHFCTLTETLLHNPPFRFFFLKFSNGSKPRKDDHGWSRNAATVYSPKIAPHVGLSHGKLSQSEVCLAKSVF